MVRVVGVLQQAFEAEQCGEMIAVEREARCGE
jgi:hypothetical protein